MNNPIISVVMPNYNGSKYLSRAIESFLAEDYDAKELLIVDGKSFDDSHKIISRYCDCHSGTIKWINTPDRGISDAINIAIDASQGSIIGYLGSDDLLSGNTFRAIARWEPFVDFDAIFFNSYTYYVNERRCVLQCPPTLDITIESLLYRGTIVGLQNTYYRRRFFNEVRFNVENKYSMDYEMLLEAASRKAMFFYVDSVATLNYFDGNISHNNAAQTLEAAYVARRFCGDYEGTLFGEDLLPEEDRRPKPEPIEEKSTEADNITIAKPSESVRRDHIDLSYKVTTSKDSEMVDVMVSDDEKNHRSTTPVSFLSRIKRLFEKR